MSSAPQPIAYFGRAMQLSITPQSGGQTVTITSTPATPILDIKFNVETFLNSQDSFPIWRATITIYNLGNQTSSAITSGGSALQNMTSSTGQSIGINDALLMGDTVTLSAGYQSTGSGTFSPQANLIFTGNLLQSFSTRENVTDTKLVLICVANLAANMFAFTSQSQPKQISDWNVVQQAVKDAGLPETIDIDSLTQTKLTSTMYPRGQTYFDRPVNVIAKIAKQHNITYWIDFNGLHMKSAASNPTTADYAYSPANLSTTNASGTTTTNTTSGTVKPTIIGYPEGTQDGVMFRVLMDSQAKILDVIQIAPGTAINAFQLNYNGTNLPPLPNSQGIYIIAGLRYVGHTWGNDWYTEITAMTPSFFSTRAMIGAPSGSVN